MRFTYIEVTDYRTARACYVKALRRLYAAWPSDPLGQVTFALRRKRMIARLVALRELAV